MSWRWHDDYGYFPPSQPRPAKGGIKAQTRRGAFGESWWARRWISVLESFNIGARLSRGRSYARGGRVLSIKVDKGGVKAKVQGSRSSPYEITIKAKTLSAANWKKLARRLSRQAIFVAKLLAGEMPQEIEKVFNEAGLSLFPEKLRDLHTDCSCPDWSNPCKHIAAVYYLLGEEFDRDPFLIFKLRGMDREELVGLLGGAREETLPGKQPHGPEIEQEALPPEPLATGISDFWNGASLPDDLFGEVRTPPISGAILKRLGSFPFWRGEQRFQEAIELIYALAAPRGMEVFLTERAHIGERRVGSNSLRA